MFHKYIKYEEDKKFTGKLEDIFKVYDRICQLYFDSYPKDFLAEQLFRNTIWLLYKTKGEVNPLDFYDIISNAEGSNKIVQNLLTKDDSKDKKLNKQIAEWFIGDYFCKDKTNTYSQLSTFRAFFSGVVFELIKGN